MPARMVSMPSIWGWWLVRGRFEGEGGERLTRKSHCQPPRPQMPRMWRLVLVVLVLLVFERWVGGNNLHAVGDET